MREDDVTVWSWNRIRSKQKATRKKGYRSKSAPVVLSVEFTGAERVRIRKLTTVVSRQCHTVCEIGDEGLAIDAVTITIGVSIEKNIIGNQTPLGGAKREYAPFLLSSIHRRHPLYGSRGGQSLSANSSPIEQRPPTLAWVRTLPRLPPTWGTKST